MAVSPDGTRAYVAGSTGSDYLVAAFDAASGQQLWTALYDGPSHGLDWAWSMGISPDGSRVYATGYSTGTGDLDFATVAFDASTGTQAWASRYDGPAGSQDSAESPESLAVSPDGSRVFVTGYSAGGGDADFATVAYDAVSGQELWVRRYDPRGGDDYPEAVKVSPDGSRVFVAGFAQSPGSLPMAATIAYDAATGNTLWVSRYAPSGGSALGFRMGIDPNGARVYVALQGNEDIGVVAYDALTGARLWTKGFGGPGLDGPYDLEISRDGARVFVTGGGQVGVSNFQYVTAAFEASTGARIWTSLHGRSAYDSAEWLGVGPDGSTVFVTGWQDDDYGTVAYDASTGAQLWASTYDGGGQDLAIWGAVSVDGTAVFVTGDSAGHYTTIAYGT